MIQLIVTEPFGGYGKGAHITDPAEIAAVRAGDNSHHVVAIPAVSHPEPALVEQEAEPVAEPGEPAPPVEHAPE